MPYSPLVSKIRVHNPNRKGSSVANYNYVKYIATREGVSLEDIKGINDLLHKKRIMKIDLNESILHQEADNKEYLEYITRRPRSHGLFGSINTSDLDAVSSEIASMTKSGKAIYRGIVSLSKKDGEEMGFRNANAWYNYLTKVMPEIASNLGVSCDHTWVAAFHAEEGHPHVHYMLWDNKDKVRSPFIHTSTQQKIRIYLEEEMFDDAYERGVRQALKPELDNLYNIRDFERDRILADTEQVMHDIDYVPGINYERMPVRPSNDYMRQITKETEALIMELSGNGSYKYRYLPPETKNQLNKIIDLITEKMDIKQSMESYLDSVKMGFKLKGKTGSFIKSHLEMEKREIRKRIGNKILAEIKGMIPREMRVENNINLKSGKDRGKEELHRGELNSPQEEELYRGELNSPQEEEWLGGELNSPQEEELYRGELNSPQEQKMSFYLKEVEKGYYIDWNNSYTQAMKLLYGDGSKTEQAYDLLEGEANRGNILALFDKAKIIERERIDSGDKAESRQYYKEAFEALQDVYETYDEGKRGEEYKKQYAAYRIGKFYAAALCPIEEPDYKAAEKWFQRAGTNKYAQYSLGKLYLEGKVYVSEKDDTLENQKTAFKLFNLSADQKNPYAAYELGKMYAHGVSTSVDMKNSQVFYEKALTLFLNMAEKSKDDSLFYRIGKMYMDGLGTAKNAQVGEKYIAKAAKLGNEAAKLSLAMIYLEKGEVGEREQAIKMLERMSEKNISMAQYKLGSIYADPENKEYQDLEKAIGYLEKSAEQENQYAQYKLGSIYLDSNNKEYYDLKQAILYLEKSAEQGNQYAQYKLGCIHADQQNPAYYNIDKALKYLHQSAEQGNQFAQCKYGCIFYFGKGVLRDEELGRYWLGRAAEQGDLFAKDILENQMVPLGFSYCLLKGVLSSMEALNRNAAAQNAELVRTQSKQAMREKQLHKDNVQNIDL